jgi:DNA (cytosine-5)-methyltransferase 1
LGDVTAVDWEAWLRQQGRPDILVAGAPCQAFSVAGQRRSLDDSRGNLTLFTAELVRLMRPRVFLFENVPGIFSAKDNAFGCLLGELVGAGTPLTPTGKRWHNAGLVMGPEGRAAWRVLDAQYFALAQRRTRVFLAYSPGDGPDPAAILFEQEGSQRHTPPSRKEETLAAALTSTGVGTCGADDNQAQANHLVPEVAGTLGSHGSFRFDLDSTGAFIPEVADPISANEGRTYTHEGKHNFRTHNVLCIASAHTNAEMNKDCGTTLTARQYKDPPIILGDAAVRRLTPRECERLQGFPDDHTLISWRGKDTSKCPDGPRYKAIGNSMATNVMHWIGKRIEAAL